MRTCLIMFVTGLLVAVMSTGAAHADACSAAARNLVAGKPNQAILSVQSTTAGDGSIVCVARIRVSSNDGKPPRIVERRFKP